MLRMSMVLLAAALLAGAGAAAVVAPQAVIAPAPSAGWTVTPVLDVRVRQEILDGVYHFTPADPDRNWIRVRTRAGFQAWTGGHTFQLRLNNEHRHYLHPDQALDWDEVIVDNVWWRWLRGETVLTVGRQDIAWPGGFLMFDGTPLDGSRSGYLNAVRLQTPSRMGNLDLAIVHNWRTDDLVLIDDERRAVCDADELGLALRLERNGRHLALIHKKESDPDFQTVTVDAGVNRELCCGRAVLVEGAMQYQDRQMEDDADDGWALAGQVFYKSPVALGVRAEAGAFYYSGRSGELRPFRTPWGRWPKWSELYIYTLIGESTPDRVHAAAWENIAAPRLVLTRDLGPRAQAQVGASWLQAATEPNWRTRGLLTQTGVTCKLGRGLDGHLLWEMLVPGEFHEDWGRLPPLTQTVHFLRWQVNWTL